jgi:diguanylate cyclase (GGDEF)-like protein
MKNSTVLLLAEKDCRAKLIEKLAATGIFNRIVPLKSPAALFSHLQSQSADLVCWAMDNRPAGWITQLHSMEQWHDLPLVAFAAGNDQHGLIEGFSLGASDCVPLTIANDELNARLQAQLKRWQRILELRQSRQQLQKMALTDALTGLGNRATFDMSIQQASARTQRSATPYSLLLIDLDHFKWFNDCYGHQAGDDVLRKVAEVIGNCARDADICCRYGGEEFAVILPDTEAKNAKILADRIHKQLARVSRGLRQFRQPITVSIGISSASEHGSVHPKMVIEEADRALYLAKDNGRNRTEIWRATPAHRHADYSYPQMPQLAFGT